MSDRSILSTPGEGYGALHVDKVDANSTATESFSVERIVDGKTLFFSPEGAEHLDLSQDRAWTVVENGTFWERMKARIKEWREAP